MTIVDATPATAETPELAHVLRFAYADAFAGIAAVLPHASKDDAIAPIIAAVLITPELFITTDRYAIGQYRHGAAIHPDTAEVILPRTAAEWLGKQTAKALGLDRYTSTDSLTVFIVEGTISVERDGDTLAMHRFAPLTGNYPPVSRLLDGWEPSEEAYPVHLSGAFLTRFSVTASKLAPSTRDTPTLQFEIGKTGNYSKTAPVRVTIGDKFTGLLQPNLPTR